jgi:hypothetical protein
LKKELILRLADKPLENGYPIEDSFFAEYEGRTKK